MKNITTIKVLWEKQSGSLEKLDGVTFKRGADNLLGNDIELDSVIAKKVDSNMLFSVRDFRQKTRAVYKVITASGRTVGELELC